MKILRIVIIAGLLACSNTSHAQIDLEKIDWKNIDLSKITLQDILGKVVRVDKGFSPKFYLNDVKIPKVNEVAKILGLKQNDEINKLFRTFRTGRTIFQIATYAGSAIAVYGVVKKIDNAASKKDYQTAFASAVGAVGTGVIVKLLTKGASYKAVDLFNHAAVKTIKDIFHIGMASDYPGVGLYVKL